MRLHHSKDLTVFLFGVLTLFLLTLWIGAMANRGLIFETDPSGVQRLSMGTVVHIENARAL